MNTARLSYDGRFDWMEAPYDRQWTILNHWIDATGADRFKGSFSLVGLVEIGLVRAATLETARRKSQGGNSDGIYCTNR